MSHRHQCVNVAAGCKDTYACPDVYLVRGYGQGDHCVANPLNSQECPTCAASRCADCGGVVRLEGHDTACAIKQGHAA